MSDPRSRIVDFALRRVLGREDEVDLSTQIADAFERGERGSVKLKSDTPARREHAKSAATRPGGRSQHTHRNSRPQREHAVPHAARGTLATRGKQLAAAAAVVVLTTVAWQIAGKRTEEEPAGVARGRLARLVDDRFGAPLAADTPHALELGATVWIPPGAPADLHLASGADLQIEGDSLARLVAFARDPEAAGAAGLELDYGALRASSPATVGLSLRVSGIEIEMDPATELEVLSRYDARRPPPTGAPSFTALEAEFEASTVGWVTVRVNEGAARLDVGDANQKLATGDEALVALGASPAFVPAAEVADLSKLIDELGRVRPYPEDGLADCRAALAARPALWLPLAETVVRGLRAGDSTWISRSELLDLLAFDSSRTSLRIARDAWLERPEEFTDLQKIALAERGAPEFEIEATATLTWYDPQDEETDPFPAALYLGLRGVDLGVPYLQEAVGLFDGETIGAAPNKDWDEAPRALAAAAALRQLGVSAPWTRAVEWVEQSVDEALGQGMFETSTTLAVALEFMERLDRGTPDAPLAVSRMQQKFAEHVAARVPELETEQDVRDLIARVAGR